MDKKDLKFYVSPAVETMDLELEAQLLAGSGTNAENADVDPLDDGGEM